MHSAGQYVHVSDTHQRRRRPKPYYLSRLPRTDPDPGKRRKQTDGGKIAKNMIITVSIGYNIFKMPRFEVRAF